MQIRKDSDIKVAMFEKIRFFSFETASFMDLFSELSAYFRISDHPLLRLSTMLLLEN